MDKILLIDNFDSFTYNLAHYLDELWDRGVDVLRNDQLNLQKVREYNRIVISPGPGLPNEAGNLLPIIKEILEEKKILGICLGLQAIAEIFDYQLKNLKEVVHGQATNIKVLKADDILFQGLPLQFKVGRYHSWVMDKKSNPKGELLVTSIDENENVMSISHAELPIHAVQFHPESILNEYGKEILKNWLDS